MPEVMSQGVRIYYETAGDGPPILMLHGATASIETNWRLPGWVDFLRRDHRLILLDFRGHGRSGKPHRERDYSLQLLSNDALVVLNSERIERCILMGYSMGSMVAMDLLLNHPEQFTAAILGGMGSRFPRRGEWRIAGRGEEIGPIPRRQPSKHDGSRLGTVLTYLAHRDPWAIRCLGRGVFRGRQPVDITRLHEIHVPTLIVAGTRDGLCPASRELADAIPGSRRVVISGRGHLSAVGDPRFKEAVRQFLAQLEAETVAAG